MYATCLFCNGALGRNDAVESFPVGRRLAFDTAKGRLWVVCRACERWNLTPLEERWEAVESCERLYRDTRRRAGTSNIGIARLHDGMELVRIGAPRRPEFAAWRYGDQLGRRRTRQLAMAGGALAVAAGALVWGATAGVSGLMLWQAGRPLYRLATEGRAGATIARFGTEGGSLLRVRRSDLRFSSIVRDERGAPALWVRHTNGSAVLTGRDTLRAAAKLFPAANRYGGTREDVETAVARIDHAGGAERYFASLATTGVDASRVVRKTWRGGPVKAADASGLLALPVTMRLAIEMVVHEEQERRAMEGELAELEQAWREAEEIAAIADDLLLPASVEQAWQRLRAGAG